MHHSFVALLIIIAPAVTAAELHVSAGGSDAAAGTESAPFATIARGQLAVRERIAQGLDEAIVVILHGGTYRLSAPLSFGPEDSGSEAYPVTYTAAPGDAVVISGGRSISGWTATGKDQWTASLPDVASGAWKFRQLFADGARLPRGRFPNAPELLHMESVSEDVMSLRIDSAIGFDLAGQNAELVVFQNWSISRAAILSAAEQEIRTAYSVGWMGHGPATTTSPGKPCYVENALAFVDVPGEWYLDEASGVLTYQAEAGEDPNTRAFSAPVAEQLIVLAGEADAPVRNLHFAGLNFECTAWDLPSFGYMGIQASHYGTRTEDPTHVLPGAIELRFAVDCSFTDCTLARTGACGIVLGAGCRGNRIEACSLADIGGNGIMVGWRGKAAVSGTEKGEDLHLSADWKNADDAPVANVITGNHITRCGATLHGCVGIFDAFADGTQITRNVISDMPYTGISIGFRWNTTETSQRNTLVAYNHVHDTMKMLADGGCLYTLGYQPGTVILGNVFHDAHRSSFAVGGAPNNGIFFDQGSSGMRVENNLIYNTSGEAVRFNQTDATQFTWKGNSFGVGPGRSETP